MVAASAADSCGHWRPRRGVTLRPRATLWIAFFRLRPARCNCVCLAPDVAVIPFGVLKKRGLSQRYLGDM